MMRVRIPFGALLIFLALAGCAGSGGSSPASAPSPPLTMTQRCRDLGSTVEHYNYIREHTSVRSFVILRSTFQARCPAEARRLGFTGAGLPKCQQLFEDHCSAYHDPQVGAPDLP